MPTPKDVYIILEQIEIAEEKSMFTPSDLDKEIIRLIKARADHGVRLTDKQWDKLVVLYLRSQGRDVNC